MSDLDKIKYEVGEMAEDLHSELAKLIAPAGEKQIEAELDSVLSYFQLVRKAIKEVLADSLDEDTVIYYGKVLHSIREEAKEIEARIKKVIEKGDAN